MSGDPVRDAEDYYCSLERPDREGIVTFTITIDIHAKGRDEDELLDNGFDNLMKTMRGIPATDWDWTDHEQHFEEGEDA